MALSQQQQLMAQALGGQAAGGPMPGQGGLPFAAGLPGQTQIDPMVLASALNNPTPNVNPATVGAGAAVPGMGAMLPEGPVRPVDQFGGAGSMLDYLRQIRQWEEGGMVGPRPIAPGQQTPAGV